MVLCTELLTASNYRPKNTKNHGFLVESVGITAQTPVVIHIPKKTKLILSAPFLGRDLSRKGLVDEAIAEIKQAIDFDPKYAAAHINLGNILCDEKHDYDSAATCFRTAIALDPKSALAHFNLGNAMRHKGKTDEAIAAYFKAIDIDAKFPAAHNILGHQLAQKGQADAAIEAFRKAIEIDPKDCNSYNSLGTLLSNVKHDYDGAISCFRAAIAFVPKTPFALSNLSNALLRKGLIDEAIAEGRRAIEIDPERVAAHEMLGNALCTKGLFNEGFAEYLKAIEIEPNKVNTHLNFGAHLHRNGQVDEGIAEFRKAIQIDPSNAFAIKNLASALKSKGDVDGALRVLDESLRRVPADARLWRTRAECYIAQKKWREAAGDEAQALKLEPDDHWTRFYLAACAVLADDAPEYRHNCIEALKRFGENKDEHAPYAVVRTCVLATDAVPDPAAPVQVMQRVVKTHRNAWNLYTLGMAHYRAGQLNEARARLEEAVMVDRLWTEATCVTGFALALVHHRLGHADEGRKWLDQTIERLERGTREKGNATFFPTHPVDWLSCLILRKEAEALIGKAPTKKEPKK